MRALATPKAEKLLIASSTAPGLRREVRATSMVNEDREESDDTSSLDSHDSRSGSSQDSSDSDADETHVTLSKADRKKETMKHAAAAQDTSRRPPRPLNELQELDINQIITENMEFKNKNELQLCEAEANEKCGKRSVSYGKRPGGANLNTPRPFDSPFGNTSKL